MKIDNARVRVSAIKRLIKNDMEHMREFVTASESFLTTEMKTFTKWVDKGAEGLSEKEAEYHYEWHSDTYWQLSEIFPMIQRSSLFISAMSFLESRLNQLCNMLPDKNSPTTIKLNDLKGSGIERAMLFLRKVLELEIDTNSKTWESIRTFQKIRNQLVHTGDREVKEESVIQAINKYSQSEGGVKLDAKNRIQLDSTFLNQVLNVIDMLFNQVFKATENAFP